MTPAVGRCRPSVAMRAILTGKVGFMTSSHTWRLSVAATHTSCRESPVCQEAALKQERNIHVASTHLHALTEHAHPRFARSGAHHGGHVIHEAGAEQLVRLVQDDRPAAAEAQAARLLELQHRAGGGDDDVSRLKGGAVSGGVPHCAALAATPGTRQ